MRQRSGEDRRGVLLERLSQAQERVAPFRYDATRCRVMEDTKRLVLLRAQISVTQVAVTERMETLAVVL